MVNTCQFLPDQQQTLHFSKIYNLTKLVSAKKSPRICCLIREKLIFVHFYAVELFVISQHNSLPCPTADWTCSNGEPVCRLLVLLHQSEHSPVERSCCSGEQAVRWWWWWWWCGSDTNDTRQVVVARLTWA